MNKFKILLVDDPSVKKAIRRILTANDPDEEYQFLEADLGEEALALLKTSEVHLLITGRDLLGMKGLELIAECQKKFPNTKIILFSSIGENIPKGITFVLKPNVQVLAREVKMIKKIVLG